MSNRKLGVLAAFGLCGLAAAVGPLLPPLGAQEAKPALELKPAQDAKSAQDAKPALAAVPDSKGWQAVAPGRVEPRSRPIRIGSPDAGRVGQTMVQVNDTVIAGEALIRIDNDEIRTRLAKVEAELNLRKRARDNPPSPKDAPRRKIEDAAADAERAVVEAQATVDRAAAARRAGTGSNEALEAADAALSRAREQLPQRQSELARFEESTPSVVPTELEGQLAAARIDWRGAQAAQDQLTIRAPIAGTILQLGARAGELTSPAAPQPLVVLGDLSALRVRAEIDERNFGAIRTGQPVVVRSVAFPERDFAGTVSSIAQIVGPGSFGARGQSTFTDIDVAEVVVDLTAPGPLIVGMKVDVYFRRNDP
jgi:HlyD family secretion protein